MGRRRRKAKGHWGTIHDAVVDIMDRFRPFKSGRDYYNMVYFGNEQDLKDCCLRILNALDTLEKEEQTIHKIEENKDGLVTEDGRQKILDVVDAGWSGTGYRVKDRPGT